MENMQRVWKIALTGGPCGGKTSSLLFLKKELEKLNFKVFIIPEAMTVITNCGLTYSEITSYEFQNCLIKTMLYFEDVFTNLASSFEKDVIILCDRGIFDNRAYMESDDFSRLLKENGLDEESVISRYDAVFHLMTAAIGAEEHYKLEGVRHETPEVSRVLDLNTLQAWLPYTEINVIDNSTDFNGKLKRLLNKILEIVSLL